MSLSDRIDDVTLRWNALVEHEREARLEAERRAEQAEADRDEKNDQLQAADRRERELREAAREVLRLWTIWDFSAFKRQPFLALLDAIGRLSRVVPPEENEEPPATEKQP